MTTRRGFLIGMLALGAAPAIVRAESLMRLWIPPQELYVPKHPPGGFNHNRMYVDPGRASGDMTCIVTATEINGRIIIVDRHWIPPHG